MDEDLDALAREVEKLQATQGNRRIGTPFNASPAIRPAAA